MYTVVDIQDRLVQSVTVFQELCLKQMLITDRF